MGMGFAPTWLRQVSPLLHMTTLTTGVTIVQSRPDDVVSNPSHVTLVLGLECD